MHVFSISECVCVTRTGLMTGYSHTTYLGPRSALADEADLAGTSWQAIYDSVVPICKTGGGVERRSHLACRRRDMGVAGSRRQGKSEGV